MNAGTLCHQGLLIWEPWVPDNSCRGTAFRDVPSPHPGWWGDGTSRNDVSLDECSGTLGPLNETSRKHKVPALIHPCYFAPTKTYCIMPYDRDVSIKGHCVTRKDSIADKGFQNIRTGTHRFGTSRHPTDKSCQGLDPSE